MTRTAPFVDDLSSLQALDRFARDLQRQVAIRFCVGRADRALLTGDRKMVNAAINEGAAITAIQIEIVTGQQVVPINGDVIAKVYAEDSAQPTDGRCQSMFREYPLQPLLQYSSQAVKFAIDLTVAAPENFGRGDGRGAGVRMRVIGSGDQDAARWVRRVE